MRADDAPDTSSGLLDQVRDRAEEAAWTRFVQLYQPFIRRCCRAQHMPPDDAEEVTARVLVRLAVKMSRFVYDPGKSFRGWLSGVVRNETMNYRRELSRKRPDRASGDSGVLRRLEQAPAPDCRPEPASDDSNGVAKSLHHQLAEQVHGRVRKRVSANTWEAFWLTAIEDWPASRAARKLGMSVAAVHMAKKRVREMLAEERRAVGDLPTE